MFKMARLLCLTTVIACFTASSRAQLFVANAGNGTVGEYNTDGSAINSALITFSDVTNFPRGLVVSGSNIYTCSPSGTVGFSTDDGTFHGDIIFGLQAAFLG